MAPILLCARSQQMNETITMLDIEEREAARAAARENGRRTFARDASEREAALEAAALEAIARDAAPAPALSVVEAPAPLPAAQMLIDAVTQWEANKKDVSPRGFQKRLQLSYAIFDQANLMVQEIETQHAKLVSELMSVERRSPIAGRKPAAVAAAK